MHVTHVKCSLEKNLYMAPGQSDTLVDRRNDQEGPAVPRLSGVRSCSMLFG